MSMDRPRNARRWAPESKAVALLGAAFVVVAVLLGQAMLALRSHDRLVAATLKDFASLAAERIASELNSTFAGVFLELIAAERDAHYAWVAGVEPAADALTGRLPEGARLARFSVEGDRLIVRGGDLTVAQEAWVLDAVTEHAREVYPRPAPYAVLRGSADLAEQAVVYRRDVFPAGGTYGLVIDFRSFGGYYASVLREASVLPPSFSEQTTADALMSVSLAFPQADAALFTRSGSPRTETVESTAFAAKAGRMAVRVELDAVLARTLVAGGQTQQVSLFAALAALTLCLFLVAVGLVRRGAHLASLRETFVENVSHDLRTPLTQIRMFSETLLLGRMTDHAERTRSLEIIRQQAGNLSDMVDNILQATTREPPVLQPARTDLEPLTRDTLDALAPAVRAGGATVDVGFDGSREAVVDPAAVRRILTNLLDNALKYGPRGQTVTVRVEANGPQVTFTVADEGPGVPKRERTRVWERFRRLNGTDRAVTGAGIGLAVVRQLAERHGGAVSIDEAPGGGARVSVTLATMAQ